MKQSRERISKTRQAQSIARSKARCEEVPMAELRPVLPRTRKLLDTTAAQLDAIQAVL